MKRREFIRLLGATATWPLAARAQQPERMRRVGVLVGLAESDPEMRLWLAAFRQGLEKLGWSEGRNVHIDYRFHTAGADQVQVLARELIALKPEVILAEGTSTTAAFQRESRAIPIVFVAVSDPIGSGFIASLARPGGSLTGVLQYEASITGKWLAMLKEIAPDLKRAALVANPKVTAYDHFLHAARTTASSLTIDLVPSPVENAADIERVIASFAIAPNGGLIFPPDAIYSYLTAVFGLVAWWAAEHCAIERAQNALRLRHIIPFDHEEPFAAIIRCTADPSKVDKRTRSKWSRGLRYALAYKSHLEPLDRFMKRKGGLNRCAERFSAQRGEVEHFGSYPRES
jgi:ABC-type uncharacterized transport system substrate-binding protein